jgi:DnaA family protein
VHGALMPSEASDRSGQLALRFPLVARSRFEDFLAGANGEAVATLRALAHSTVSGRFRGILLAGASGTGKTHLLQAACRSLAGDPRGAIYLPLADPLLDAEALDGLERCALVALDDVEAWLGDPVRERVLLGLYQGMAAGDGALLVASQRGAAALATHYSDLLSRLRALQAYALAPLDDAGKASVLRRLAGERGLDLPQPVLDFWLARGERDLARLIEQFERLDAAALVEQRRVTIPLLKAVLGW